MLPGRCGFFVETSLVGTPVLRIVGLRSPRSWYCSLWLPSTCPYRSLVLLSVGRHSHGLRVGFPPVGSLSRELRPPAGVSPLFQSVVSVGSLGFPVSYTRISCTPHFHFRCSVYYSFLPSLNLHTGVYRYVPLPCAAILAYVSVILVHRNFRSMTEGQFRRREFIHSSQESEDGRNAARTR